MVSHGVQIKFSDKHFRPFHMGVTLFQPRLFRWSHSPPPLTFSDEFTLLRPQPFQMESSSSTRTNTVCLLLNLKFTLYVFPSSSPAINKPADQRVAPDLQSNVSGSDRLMIKTCQFLQFIREHPLENWTVGSLPNLT